MVSLRKQRALRFVQRNKDAGTGQLVSDPIDRGGPTRWGVTDRVARKHKKNLISLTEEEAGGILLSDYWSWDWVVDDDLAIRLFDYCVNSGLPNTSVILQLALQRLGVEITPDRIIGPKTRMATNLTDPRVLHEALVMERKSWLRRLVERDPSQQRFLSGWLARAGREIPD